MNSKVAQVCQVTAQGLQRDVSVIAVRQQYSVSRQGLNQRLKSCQSPGLVTKHRCLVLPRTETRYPGDGRGITFGDRLEKVVIGSVLSFRVRGIKVHSV